MDYPFTNIPSRPETPQPTTSQSTRSTSEQASTSAQQDVSQTLDAEMANVWAGIGSFWGRVRKQSAIALKDAEKQLEEYTASAKPFVEKAKENLDHFSENARAEIERLSQATDNEAQSGVVFGADGTPIIVDPVKPVAATASSSKGKEKAVESEDPATSATHEAAAASSSSPESSAATAEKHDEETPAQATLAFLNRLQSQIASNPNVKELSKNLTTLQTSVAQNLTNLPHSVQANIEQLQTQFSHIDLTDSQKVAEGYLHKGEHWLHELTQEVTRIANHAVVIVPPTTNTNQSRAAAAAIGRKELLLAKLRSSPAALMVDPAQPPQPTPAAKTEATSSEGKETTVATRDTREDFAKFLQTIEDAGGFESESWLERIRNETKQAGDQGLNATFAQLVPNTLSAEAFWTRYFFRVSEIERDEANRKRVLESSARQDDEDFSWDVDDEEDTAKPAVTGTSDPTAKKSTGGSSTPSTGTPKAALDPSAQQVNKAATSASSENDWGSTTSDVEDNNNSKPHAQEESTRSKPTSPRTSSDGTAGSYDVVNAASGAPSEVARSVAGGDDDEDSDWE